MDIWIIAKKKNGNLTAIGADLTESAAQDLPGQDGNYVLIPIQLGKEYGNIADEGLVGAVNFPMVSIKTLVQQVKDAIQGANGRLTTLENKQDTIISQGQQMQQVFQ